MISLPGDNYPNFRKSACMSTSSKDRVTGRQLARIIGLLSSAIPAILPAPLHYQALQRLRYQALQQSQGNYESTTHLSTDAQRDLHRWIHDEWSPHPSTNSRHSETSDASKTEHIPAQKNVEADTELRRALDQSNWMLNQEIFQALELKWGPFDVDLFTARHNKQLKRFFSFRPDPEGEQ